MLGNGTIDREAVSRIDFSVLDDVPESLEICSLGEGLKRLEDKPVEMNLKLAEEVLSLHDFAADRKMDMNHVARLKSAMERGTFIPDLVQLITCQCKGTTYRLNCQHVAAARLQMPKEYRCPIRHIRYSAKTENDVRRLYASIDRGKPRNKATVVTSYLFETPEWAGFGRHVIGWISEGLSLWLWQSKHVRTFRDGDDRAFLLMTDYLDLGRKVGRFIQSHQNNVIKFLRRAPVIAAMFATFQKDEQAATQFWSSIAEGAGFTSSEDPRRVLRDGLMQASLKQGAGGTKRAAESEEMYRWCVNQWNSWRRGDRSKILRANMKNDRPTAI